MDAFSRSLAAAALVDGQHFTLPGFGTIEGVYISARIDHAARKVEAPKLEVRWESKADPSAQTFADFLVSTGATTFEAEDIQNNWLDALATGESIEVGDLGSIVSDSSAGVCHFEENPEGLASAFSGRQSVALEPISKRALPDAPVAPVVAIDTKNRVSGSPKNNTTFIQKLVPYASAAAIVLLGILAVNYFTAKPVIESDNGGKVVAVNQDRLNRSPREEATTADFPSERIDVPTSSDMIGEEPDLNQEAVVEENAITEATRPASIENGQQQTPVVESRTTEGKSQQREVSAPSFDPAALAGGLDDDHMFAISEIDVVIVLGSFGSSANAARMTEEVAAAGLIPYVDQPGNLTRVGATFSVTSEAEIEELKQRMRKQFNPNAWVLE